MLPLWVADMDFAAPEAVTRALAERAAHPVYGYTFYPDSLYDALIDWLKKRHGWAGAARLDRDGARRGAVAVRDRAGRSRSRVKA